jgi:AcrR family transcriptional regulator
MRAAKTDTETRQEQIAEAAMEMIASGGLASLSIPGIAERVGIVTSGVYRHYGSKEAVLDAVLDLLRGKLLGNVARVRQETSGALGRLQALFMLHMTMLADNPAFPHVVFAQFSQADRPEGWQRLRDTMCAYVQEVVQIVEEGQRDGEIRSDLPAKTAAVMFIGLVLPAAMLHRLSEGDFDTASHIETAWPAFARCMSAD